MLDLALYFMGYPEPDWVLAQTFRDFIQDKSFKGPWGIPDVARGVTDVESACHGFVRLKTGQVISLQVSWAELVKREEISVTFQGTKAAASCDVGSGATASIKPRSTPASCTSRKTAARQPHHRGAARRIDGPPRIRGQFCPRAGGPCAAAQYPDQALTLMRIIDAAYASARAGRPVKC